MPQRQGNTKGSTMLIFALTGDRAMVSSNNLPAAVKPKLAAG